MEIKAKEIILFRTDLLSEFPENANKHTKEQLDRLKELIEFYGNRDPIIVDNDKQEDGTHWVICGNGRLQLANREGWDHLPAIFQSFASYAEKYGFMVSHNAINSSNWGGGLDLSGINKSIVDLGPDFNIDLLGINEFTIEPAEKFEMEDELREDMNKKFLIEVTFPNDMEMMDIHDDLVSRGYIVRIKK